MGIEPTHVEQPVSQQRVRHFVAQDSSQLRLVDPLHAASVDALLAHECVGRSG